MSGDARTESVSISNVSILIDGNNVVMEDRKHGWRVLKTLLDWLDNNEKKWFLYFDATIWYAKGLNGDGKRYIKSLIDKEQAKVCPSRTEADAFILLHADKEECHIISNDGYKKWEVKYPWIAERTETGNLRVHKFTVKEDILMIPDFDMFEKIVVDANKSNLAKIEAWRKSAERGDPQAQYCLGNCYFTGNGIESDGLAKDIAEAVKWYRKAAEQGHIDAKRNLGSAQHFLGVLYFYGQDVKKDKTEAFQWHLKAAECGDSGAQYDLGRCYYEGNGVGMDKSEAVKWYRKSAEQGYAEAQRELCTCCSIGDGVAQDLEEAEKWCRKVMAQVDERAKSKLEQYCNDAEQGNAEAQFQMGKLYWGDNCVLENPFVAAKWFRKAAEQGHLEAQYQLGECYYEGFNLWGVEIDEFEAVKWYRKAAAQGHIGAQKKLLNYGWMKPDTRI